MGSCGIPLKSILKSESLYIDKEMEIQSSEKVTANASLNSSKHAQNSGLGALKVCVFLYNFLFLDL